MNKKYFDLAKTGKIAQLNIYGDITSWPYEWLGEVSAVSLSKQLEKLEDVDEIQVFINSYGGDVSEGLAIYNALKRHSAKVKTVVDGFACSIASVIFMAGDERIMNDSSLLMVHNAWASAVGNAGELRKAAEDLDTINRSIVTALLTHSKLDEKEVEKLMDKETWILPDKAVEYGFATAIEASADSENVSASAKKKVMNLIKANSKPIPVEPEGKNKEPEDKNKEPEGKNKEPEDKNIFDALFNVLK